MYVPRHFAVADNDKIAAAIREHGFATLITHDGKSPFATHLPILFTPDDSGGGVLQGHMARANPQWQHFSPESEVLAIFAGPHAYISPSWYSIHPSVPTWNYVAIHVYGLPTVHQESEWLAGFVRRLVAVYEANQASPWTPDLPDDYERNMLGAIVGFEIAVTRIEAKFKLGQNRTPADLAGVHLALSSSAQAGDRDLAALMVREGLAAE